MDIGKDIFKQEAGNVLKESGIGAEGFKDLASGNVANAATSMFNKIPEVSAYNTLSGDASAADKARGLIPSMLGTTEQNKQYASALQLPQAAAPQMSQAPSYAAQTPYIGGGIEEILARQRGLLR